MYRCIANQLIAVDNCGSSDFQLIGGMIFDPLRNFIFCRPFQSKESEESKP